jgi:drug/metabolite transporter (DMT)-like permease
MSPRLLAALAMLGSVAIYGSNFAISRHATQAGLAPADLMALRFGVSGLLLLPVFLARGGGFADCAGVSWPRGLVLAAMSGPVMSGCMLIAISLAPAAHTSAIGPGMVTIVGVIGAWFLFGQRPSLQVFGGLAIAFAGLVSIAASGGGGTLDPARVLTGDLLMVLTGLLWGGYPLMVQRWKLDPLTATTVVCVLSLVYVPFYLVFFDHNLTRVPLSVVLFHAVNQGVLNVIVGLWLWSWAARAQGASFAGKFPPLIPVIGTLTGIPLLGEIPGTLQTLGCAAIVAGLLVIAFARR